MNDEEIMPDETADDDLLNDEPAAVREELRRKLKTEGARVAIDTMLEVCRDRKAQASARATCAVALMRGAGYLGKRADDEDASEGKSIDQMSIAEMDAELKRLRVRGRRAQRVLQRDSQEDNGSVFD